MENNVNITKNFMTGVFQMNAELTEIDAAVFITILRHAIETASHDNAVQDELLTHAQNLYIADWLQSALRDEGVNYNEEKETADATKKFTAYYSNPLTGG